MVQIIRRTERESPAKQIYQSYLEGQERKRQKQQDALALQEKQYGRNVDAAKFYTQGYQFDPQSGSISKRDDYTDYDQLNKQAEYELNSAKAARLKGGLPMAQASGAVGESKQQSLVPKTYDEYGLPASYYDPNVDLEQKRKEEELKREFELSKPLTAEAAVKVGGARQSLQQAQAIKGIVNEQNFPEVISGVGKIRMARDLGINMPGSIRGKIANALPLVGASLRLATKTNDFQKKAELALNLIAENNVRAKSGAAVPEPEQVREEARQLLSDDSFRSFLNRLATSETYNAELAESIRPGSSKVGLDEKYSGLPKVQQQQSAAPEWVPQGFENDYSEAKRRGATDDEIRQAIMRSIG